MKTHRTRNLLATLALTTGAWLLAPGLQAATPTWDGTTDMNWTQPDSTSWTGGTYSSGDTAIFNGAGQGTVNVQAGGVTPGAMSISSGNYTFTGGSIGGSFYLDLTSTGTTRFAGTNTFVGTYHSLPVSVISKPSWSSNVIEIANANSLGSGAILCSGYGTTTLKNTSGGLLTLPNRWGGDWWLNSGSGAVDGSDMEMSGQITVPGGGGNSFGITVKGASQTLTLSGNITCGLGLTGPGTVNLTSTSTAGITSYGLGLYGQGTAGTGVKCLLANDLVSADTYFGTPASSSYGLVSIQATGGARTLGGPVRFYPYSQTVQFTGSNKLTFTGNVAATYNPNGSGLTLEVTDPAGVTQFNGNWTIGSCPIKKTGPGTLVVNGTMSGSNGVQINAGTLSGTGTLPSVAVSIANGATVAPGNSAGTLTVPGSLTLNNTTNLAYELGDSLVVGASDKIVTTSLTLDGVLNISALTGFGIPAGAGFARYSLISYNALTANNGLALGTNPGGPFNYILGYTAGVGAGAGDVFLMIPEPASILLVGAGLLLARRRR